MTALKKYQRLESSGIWRANAAAQRRDVVVSFGDASLVICDQTLAPLAHWSLAAVRRVGGGGTEPAIFAPDPQAEETLEIDDPTMAEAIDTVRAAMLRSRPRPGRLRRLAIVGLWAVLAALVIFWLPGALLRQTLRVVPAATRAEIGKALLHEMESLAGAPCDRPLGIAALARLGKRLLGANGERLLVMPGGGFEAIYLPGGIILLNRALVERHETPEVAAGTILAEHLRAAKADPLAPFLRHAGARTTLRLLTTGEIGKAPLASYARVLMAPSGAPPALAPLPARLAGVPLMRDGDWLSLQGICAN